MQRWLSALKNADPAQTAFVCGVLILIVCYTLVFLLTVGSNISIGNALLDALINVGALALWSLAAWWFNLRVLLGFSLKWQWLVQSVTAFAYAFAWYFSVTVLLGWRAGDFAGSFSVRPFSNVAFIWQTFQGLTVYALVVALAVIQLLWSRQQRLQAAEPTIHHNRLLVRGEDEFVSVLIDDILSIERAGDYAQIVTPKHRHLTRKSLAELERQLPQGRFIRVHRGHLINLDALESVESIGGGRMRVHLSGGISVETSRSGAQILRKYAA